MLEHLGVEVAKILKKEKKKNNKRERKKRIKLKEIKF